MTWRDTWRETVESFMRELRGPEGKASAEDAVVRAIAQAREAVRRVESELARVQERLAADEKGVEVCRRRRELAERIGDERTAAVAQRFERRHRERIHVLRRKAEVLHDEHSLARTELDELLELVRREIEAETAPVDSERPAE